MSKVLEARGLTRILPGPQPTTLVDGVDVAFEENSLTVITGPSGSGKSSLLYLLGLLDPPTRGDVLVDGGSTRGLDNELRGRLRLEHFGFVFQFHFLLPELSVIDNVMLPMRQLGRRSASAMRERAFDLLAAFGIGDEARKVPGGPVRRPETARGGRPRARQRPAFRPRRRADGRARFEERGGGVLAVPSPRRRRPHRDRRHA